MAEFEAKVYKLTIEEHPNADRLELAVVGDYRSIVMKGQFQTGNFGVYIPEASIVPDWLIKEMGLVGKLAGKQKNRVKAVKLRKVLSQGLVYPLHENQGQWYIDLENEGDVEVNLDDNVTELLNITKWEPPIPIHMEGEVFNAFGKTLKYDIENYKKHPDVLIEDELVSMTEKVHGSWVCYGYHPNNPEKYIITSKGLSAKGLAFKLNEKNNDNLYIKALYATTDPKTGYNVLDRLLNEIEFDSAVYILGEIYGVGVQDLHYGAQTPQFKVFDIYYGTPGNGDYISTAALSELCKNINIEMVPELYNGKFSKTAMLEVTNGKEMVSGDESNIREGVVIKPIIERQDPVLGRVILKSVSETYLLRKNGTEYN